MATKGKGQHTPTPWTCHSGMVWAESDPENNIDGYPIAHMDRNTPHTRPTERDANAHLIVTAVNHHAELAEMLDHLLVRYDNLNHETGDTWEDDGLTRDARALLARLDGANSGPDSNAE
jgi:hypothetical protein